MIRYVALALLAAVPRPSAAQEPPMLSAEQFTILPWSVMPGDAEVLASVRECGFNLAGFVAPEALDAVQAAGLRGLVMTGPTHVGDAEAALPEAEVARRVRALVDRTAAHPATYGYYLRDEPSAAAFAGLGRWAAAYAQAAPGKLAYINLFPSYASTAQLGAESYEAYLEQFVQQARPSFISYDHYALMEGGTLRGGYFENLAAVRRVALRHGLPFWNIVLANAHFNYAEPSAAGLRFQLYTTLAHGARGISYFTYITPNVGNYRLAPLDQFHHRTPTWDLLRNVNLQVHRLGPAYLKLTSRHVYHQGEVPEGCADSTTRKLPLVIEGGNLLVGEFDAPDGRTAVMVVNKSLHASTPFGITGADPARLRLISPYTGGEEAFAGEQVWLAPGQGSLVVKLP